MTTPKDLIRFARAMRVIRLLPLLLLLFTSHAFAVQPDEVLADEALELRARVISKELRCLVCQNQSIDDSDAAMAKDLRVFVRERLTAGDTDHQVYDAVTQRFGNFVLLDPPFNSATWFMWLAPFVVLVTGGLAAWKTLRRQADEPAQLSDEDRQRVKDFLKRT